MSQKRINVSNKTFSFLNTFKYEARAVDILRRSKLKKQSPDDAITKCIEILLSIHSIMEGFPLHISEEKKINDHKFYYIDGVLNQWIKNKPEFFLSRKDARGKYKSKNADFFPKIFNDHFDDNIGIGMLLFQLPFKIEELINENRRLRELLDINTF